MMSPLQECCCVEWVESPRESLYSVPYNPDDPVSLEAITNLTDSVRNAYDFIQLQYIDYETKVKAKRWPRLHVI